jgi:AraC-like DNA-binding protein
MLEMGMKPTESRRNPEPGLSVAPIGPQLLDAALRLLCLLETPRDIPVLAPLVVREMLYRLLSGEQADRLRHIALSDHRQQSVNRAIGWLKEHFAEPFRIETIARFAHVSPSALHHNFKAVTAMSPLQYQKQLRLQEARRLMLGESLDAAGASHSVGYESPSQFSREYSRLFGAPPSRDIAQLKRTAGATP